MKKLEDIINGKSDMKGYTLLKYKESKHAYMYLIVDEDNISQIRSYEVFEKRIRKKHVRIIDTREIVYPESEVYPTSKNFGVWAWCFNNKERAIEKFNNINKN